MPTTDRHGYSLPSDGTVNWGIILNDVFSAIDTDMPVWGPAADRPSSSNSAENIYIETDGDNYIWKGDGSGGWINVGTVNDSGISGDVITYGPAADKPSSPSTAGEVYVETDQDNFVYENQSGSWVKVGSINVFDPSTIGEGDLGFDPATQTELDSHTSRTDNPHTVTKSQVGLGTSSSPEFSAVTVDESTHGSNPADTITEQSSAKGFSFSASDDRDLKTAIDVTISNGTSSSVSEDVTVEFYDGADTTGTLLGKETQTVTVSATSSGVATFLTGYETLDTGDYYVNITQSGTTLTVDQTDVFTVGGEYVASESTTGDLTITDHENKERAQFDAKGGFRTDAPLTKRSVGSGEHITVPSGYGWHVPGDLQVDGTLEVDGFLKVE